MHIQSQEATQIIKQKIKFTSYPKMHCFINIKINVHLKHISTKKEQGEPGRQVNGRRSQTELSSVTIHETNQLQMNNQKLDILFH